LSRREAIGNKQQSAFGGSDRPCPADLSAKALAAAEAYSEGGGRS